MSKTKLSCPAFMIAAPASRQGKTLFTASVARHYRRRGYRVQVFKIGPDFLDPKILEQASDQPVYNLDLWMMGESHCRDHIDNARKHNDIVLIESVMGLFDHDPSNAELAQRFSIPIILLIDASSMGASFAAIAYGMTQLQPDLHFIGVVANRVASPNHQELIQKKLPSNIPFLGSIPRDQRMQLPERHLGLYQPEELVNFDVCLNQMADVFTEAAIKIESISKRKQASQQRKLAKKTEPLITIAIAKDQAFSFIYPDNVRYLQSIGCHIVYFSPLTDNKLPGCDALWLPGGYPELYAEQLAENTDMQFDIIQHVQQDKAVYAECGGMLYLFDSLNTKEGNTYKMCGLLSGKVIMEGKLQGIGMQELSLFGDSIRGHSFHHARIETAIKPIQQSHHRQKTKQGENIYAKGSIYASFLHLWFSSSERLSKRLFGITD